MRAKRGVKCIVAGVEDEKECGGGEGVCVWFGRAEGAKRRRRGRGREVVGGKRRGSFGWREEESRESEIDLARLGVWNFGITLGEDQAGGGPVVGWRNTRRVGGTDQNILEDFWGPVSPFAPLLSQSSDVHVLKWRRDASDVLDLEGKKVRRRKERSPFLYEARPFALDLLLGL